MAGVLQSVVALHSQQVLKRKMGAVFPAVFENQGLAIVGRKQHSFAAAVVAAGDSDEIETHLEASSSLEPQKLRHPKNWS